MRGLLRAGRLLPRLSSPTRSATIRGRREHLRTAESRHADSGAGGWADLAAHHRQPARIRLPRPPGSSRAPPGGWASPGPRHTCPDLKGLRDIATLLAAQGHDVHVYTLLGRHEPALGADPVLDDESRRRYRRRIETLHADIERADEDGDVATSQAASLELDALLRELSVTTGLRGRRRRLGDEVDRARKTVSARIHDSLERLAQVHPTLGAHLTPRSPSACAAPTALRAGRLATQRTLTERLPDFEVFEVVSHEPS